MIGVTEQCHRKIPPLGRPLHQGHHRAGVRIHPDVHQRSSISTVRWFPRTVTVAMLPQMRGI